MDYKKRQIIQPILLLASLFMLSGTSCSAYRGVPQWTGSGFLKKEFLGYKRVAILPFEGDSTGEVSDTFGHSLRKKFPQIEIVGRKEFLRAFDEGELPLGQLNEATRVKMGHTLGAQALVLGSVYYPSILRWLFQLQIVDVETGEVTGRSLVEIDFMGAERIKEACDLAAQMLKLR